MAKKKTEVKKKVIKNKKPLKAVKAAKPVKAAKTAKPVKAVKAAKPVKAVKEPPQRTLTEEMKKLLQKKTADAYVDFSVKSSLTPAEKRIVTRLWLAKTGLKIEDINYARNRHPYWKKIKMKGASERTKSRMEKFDFSKGKHKKWGKEELLEFLDLNSGKADFELAEHFKCSIPAVQGVRRLYNLAVKILDIEGKKKNKTALHKLMLINEKALRNMYKELSPAKTKARKK